MHERTTETSSVRPLVGALSYKGGESYAIIFSNLQEWRTTCIALEKARLEQAVTNCSWFSKKKKPQAAKNGGVRAAFDASDVVTYEEVVRLPGYHRKTLVLIGTRCLLCGLTM